MDRLLLLRYEDDSLRTFGILVVPPGDACHTVERPWLDNKPFVSCIPPGVYTLRPWESPTKGKCLKIEGCEPERTDCLIHRGNVVKDVTGCVAVGEYRGNLANAGRKEPAVLNSKLIMRQLLTRIVNPVTLEIREALG